MNAAQEGIASVDLVPACRCEVTARGPNWLFLRIESIGLGCGLAERVWGVARREFVYRLVLEFHEACVPDARLAVELRSLCDRLDRVGGSLRLCGLTPEAAGHLLDAAHCPRLHNHASARDAVWCGPCAERSALRPLPR